MFICAVVLGLGSQSGILYSNIRLFHCFAIHGEDRLTVSSTQHIMCSFSTAVGGWAVFVAFSTSPIADRQSRREETQKKQGGQNLKSERQASQDGGRAHQPALPQPPKLRGDIVRNALGDRWRWLRQRQRWVEQFQRPRFHAPRSVGRARSVAASVFV